MIAKHLVPNVVVDGERWFRFFSNFQYAGKTYSFDFFARNQEEAEEMLAASELPPLSATKSRAKSRPMCPALGYSFVPSAA
jgi:hypothetical protein